MASRLEHVQSPYLRQHAGNPVDWFPWGREAFDEARRRDAPVLVSIGYSTCHWCHVMARESFADPETAADLAEGFVAIKVDREEHPEVDASYMAAASAFTPHLGWPLTVFTTPEGVPFYAGTYYPPAPRPPLPAFRDVLRAVREAWTNRRDEVDATASAITASLARSGDAAEKEGSAPSAGALIAAARSLAAQEDPDHGGFVNGPRPASNTPKFPVATALGFLLSPLVRGAAPAESAAAARAMTAMAGSELRDPVGGGFFRYATRRDWGVPHYERMLTDNALLLDAETALGDHATAAGIASFLLEVLRRPSGGFGAAQDSESIIDGRRDEGGYYARDAAGRAGLEPPAVDGKVVTGWNGLAIGALARAGARWGEPHWIAAAEDAARTVLRDNRAPDAGSGIRGLVRASLEGTPSAAAATLADYGQLARGLVALAVAGGAPEHAAAARELVDACFAEAPDGPPAVPGGGDPVLREGAMTVAAEATDGDQPSGLSAIAAACLDLWLLGAPEQYRRRAERIVAAHAPEALARPLAHGELLRVAAVLADAPRQVVVVTAEPAAPLVVAARAVDADVVAIVTPDAAAGLAAAGFSLFEGKTAAAAPVAYDCRAFVCRLPTTDPVDLPRERVRSS